MTSKHLLSRSKISSQPNCNGFDMNIRTSTLYEICIAWVQISLSAVNIYSEISSAIIGFLGLVWKPCPSLNALPPSKKNSIPPPSITLWLLFLVWQFLRPIYAKSCSTGDLPNIQISWKKANVNFWFNIYSLKIV